MRAGILGGGIAGLGAAIALRLAGHDVHVFERRHDEGGLGAGVVCWPNAAFVLRELGVEIGPVAGRPRAMRRLDDEGRELGALDLRGLNERLGHPSLSVDSFGVFNSLSLLAITYLGGIASVAGALVAGLLADGGIVSAASGGDASQTRFAVQGALLIVMAAVYPEGISGAASALKRRVGSALGKGTGAGTSADTAADDEPGQSSDDSTPTPA